MTVDFYDRRKNWQPTPRPEWVRALNEEGAKLDMRSVVPLTVDSLIDQTIKNTGLNDFGEGNWRTHFSVLMDAIDKEGNLHFAGRILTRSEFVRYLEARLNIIECYKQNPEIDDEVIDSPVMITGYGRSGTTILFEVLSQDPQFRVSLKWEALFPCPPPEAENYTTDPRIALADQANEFSEDMIPELKTMHKIAGSLPVESVELVYLTFLSEVFPMAFQVPSYARYLEQQDLAECFEWQKKILKLLQFKYKKRHWLLKGPSHLPYLPELLKVYPDMKLIFTHRDPVATADSVVSLLGSLYWWRTDKPWGDGAIDTWALSLADDRAKVWDGIIDMLDRGDIDRHRVSQFHYAEFMVDPMSAVRKIYRDLSLELTDDIENKMLQFLEAKPKGKFGEHVYHQTPADVVEKERRVYSRYQQYFDVRNEI